MKNYFLTKSNKFKNNMFNITIPTKLDENISALNLLAGILKQSSEKYPDSKYINSYLQNLYGASLDIFINVKGDSCFFNIYIKCLNDRFALDHEELCKESLELLYEIIFNPLIKENKFDENIFRTERKNLIDFIEARTDDKDNYASERIEEISYKGEPCGINKYGDVNILKKITNEELYSIYKKIILNGKKHVFAVGDVPETILSDFSKKINKESFVPLEPEKIAKYFENTVVEKEILDVNQGKLSVSYEIDTSVFKGDFFASIVMNSILGDGASSKLFRVIREEHSLCYSIYSYKDSYKGILFVSAGIDMDKFDTVTKLIDVEIENMKNGNFTDLDIKLAKEKLIVDYKSVEDSMYGIIGFMIGKAMYGLDYTVAPILEEIEKVDRSRVMEVSKKLRKRAILTIEGKEK